ncbi:MAG: glycosyltransferase [Candidatus Kerfeldbacteria bacterium]|nr:glycosyltransferase [Candidatus Kerfeldbacteria bacterium]
MIHRTLLLTAAFPPAVGGAERYLQQLTDHLDRDRVVVVAPPHPAAPEFDAKSPVRIIRRDLHRSRLIRPAWAWHVAWMMRTIRRQGISRLVFGHYGGFVALGPLMKFLTGTPYLVSVFGLDFTSYRKTWVRRTLLRWTLRKAEWVTTISEHTQSLLRDFGVPEGKIVLAPPGIDPIARPSADELLNFRRTLGISVGTKVLLTVGRLVKRKGHHRVIRALPKVLERIADLQYLIVGDGEYRRSIEQSVQQLGLTAHVKMTGRIAQSDLTTAFAAADAFITTPVVTRDDPEGFGIVFTEALRVGTPIIATNSGGVSDIIRDGVNGLALDDQAGNQEIADVIIKLMENDALRKQLGTTGQVDVQARFPVARQVAPFRAMLANTDDPTSIPLVSVVIPTWNNAESLAHTLHHLMLQTYRHLEIIVVDDGSTDQTSSVVKNFPHVKYLLRPHAGAPAARNSGRAVAHGQFILFCDADVMPHPRMIERMATALLVKPGASYAYCNFRFGWRTFDLFDFDPARLRRSNFISMMSLIRTADCPPFDESLTRLQDWDLWLTMLERNQVGTWVPSRLFSAAAGKRGISRKIQAPPAAAVQRIRSKHHLDKQMA